MYHKSPSLNFTKAQREDAHLALPTEYDAYQWKIQSLILRGMVHDMSNKWGNTESWENHKSSDDVLNIKYRINSYDIIWYQLHNKDHCLAQTWIINIGNEGHLM